MSGQSVPDYVDTYRKFFINPREDGVEEIIERKTWLYWFLVMGMMVLISGALAVMLLIHDNSGGHTNAAPVWPWAGTAWTLVTALAVMVGVSMIYLTHQQRKLIRVCRRLNSSDDNVKNLMGEHCERLFGLLTVSRAMATASDVQTVLDCISQTCCLTFNGEQVSLMLLDHSANELVVRAATGHIDMDEILGRRIPVGEGIAGWVAEHGKPLNLGSKIDGSRYPGFKPSPQPPKASMISPITVRGELVGVLNIASRSEGEDYSAEDLQAFMVFAENAGIASRYAEQADWMRQTIQRLDSALLEREDPELRKLA